MIRCPSTARLAKLLMVLILLLCLLALTAATDLLLTVTHVIQALDQELTNEVKRFDPVWLTLPMVIFTLVGEDPPLDLFALAVAFCAFRRGHRLDAVLLIGVATAARIVGAVLKYVAHQPRPSLSVPPWPLSSLHGYGYPSGHALLSMAILGFGAVVLGRLLTRSPFRWLATAACCLLILFIGWSRVYLGFHWLNDVIGGYLFGALIALTGWVLQGYARMRAGEQHGPRGGELVGQTGRPMGQGPE